MKKSSRRWGSLFWGVVIVSTLIALFFPASMVAAHANLVRSDPQRGAVLAQPPKHITLEFSESLDPGLSQVQLLDSKGQVIVRGPGVVSAASPSIITLDLPALPNGSYTAAWQTHSAADGHFANGTVAFSIGKSDPNVSLLPPLATRLPAEAIPGPVEIALRWLTYLAAACLGGPIFFGVCVWRPAYRKSQSARPEMDQTAAAFLKRLAFLGAALLLLATLAAVIDQAFSAVANGMQPSLLSALAGSLNFNENWQSWLRLLLLAAVLFFVPRLTLPASQSGLDWAVLVPFVVLILATISLQSHAAAAGDWLPIGIDVVHLAAMTAWLGGLLPLFYLLRTTGLEPSLLVPHFSRIALSSVLLLSGTGLYTALAQIRTLDALLATSYGIALIVKLVLFALLVALGAVNLLVITPRFKNIEKGQQGMRLTLRVELGLSLVLWVAVAVLSGTSPSFEALQAEQRMGSIGDFTQDGIQLRLWLVPGSTGENQIAADISGLAPAELNQATVLFRFQKLDRDLGTTQAQASPDPAGPNRFQVRGSYFTLAGNWQVEVILRRPEINDVRSRFVTFIRTDPNDTDPANPFPTSSEMAAAGKIIYQNNCANCHGTTGAGDGPLALHIFPRPANLQIHTATGTHSDGQLFYWVSRGILGTQMPRFDTTLTEPERWQVVEYIRTLSITNTK